MTTRATNRLKLFILLVALSTGSANGLVANARSMETVPSSCAVTLPNGSQPPTKMLGGPTMHGNGKLWVSLSLIGGKLLIVPDADGKLSAKLAWWRAAKGPFTIQGRRLDAPGGSLQSDVRGYGNTGFLASGVIFPTAGCWEITGKAGDAALTFVVEVEPASQTVQQKSPCDPKPDPAKSPE
jgi:hypothetical protein